MRRAGSVVTLGFMIACKGGSPGAAQPTSSGPPPAVCPAVTFACTMPGRGCIEGGDDYAARARGECTAAGGATPSDGACPREATLGTCTMYEGLMPDLHACATLVFAASDGVPDAAAAQAKCEKFKGTYAAP